MVDEINDHLGAVKHRWRVQVDPSHVTFKRGSKFIKNIEK